LSVFVLEHIDPHSLFAKQFQVPPHPVVVEPEIPETDKTRRTGSSGAARLVSIACRNGMRVAPAFTECQYSESARSAGFRKTIRILASGTLAKMLAAAVRDHR
jgi:hypothetical protein